MAEKETQYVTPYKYAQLCGVSPTAINQRIKNNKLPVVELTNPIDGTSKRYVDIIAYPVAQTMEDLRNYPTTFKGSKNKAEK